MWLFLINPLQLCSYGIMAVEVYRVMFVNQVAVNVIYLAWILKCLKLDPSISLIDDSAAATQPLSRSARVADAATQPLCPLSHSARLADAATQPLSHSAKVAGAATQTLCHSARVAGAATQPLSHSAILPQSLPEWLEQPLSHSARVAGGAATHSARVAGAATQPLSHSAIVAGAATQPLSHSEWLSGWVAEWLMWKFPPLRVQSAVYIYIALCLFALPHPPNKELNVDIWFSPNPRPYYETYIYIQYISSLQSVITQSKYIYI